MINRLPKKYLVTLYILFTITIVILLYLIFIEFSKGQVLGALESVQTTQAQDTPARAELAEINALFPLPDESQEIVYFGKIKDIEALKTKKEFFKKAKNGDLLIIYPEMSIIYDPVNKVVVDIAKEKIL